MTVSTNNGNPPASAPSERDFFYPPYILDVNQIAEAADFAYTEKECNLADFNPFSLTNIYEKKDTITREGTNLLYRTTAVLIGVLTTVYLTMYKWNASAFLKKVFVPILNWRYCPSFVSSPQFQATIFLFISNKAYKIFIDYITNSRISLAKKQEELDHWIFVEKSSKAYSLEFDKKSLLLARKPSSEVKNNNNQSPKEEVPAQKSGFDGIELKKLPWMSAVSPQDFSKLEAPLKTLLFSYLFFTKAFDTRYENYKAAVANFKTTPLPLEVVERQATELLYEALIFKMRAAFALFLLGNPTCTYSLETLASFNSGKDLESRFIDLILYWNAGPYFYKSHGTFVGIENTPIPRIALLFQQSLNQLSVKELKKEQTMEPATTLDIEPVEKTETQTA